jgi:hypothetical protein
VTASLGDLLIHTLVGCQLARVSGGCEAASPFGAPTEAAIAKLPMLALPMNYGGVGPVLIANHYRVLKIDTSRGRTAPIHIA